MLEKGLAWELPLVWYGVQESLEEEWEGCGLETENRRWTMLWGHFGGMYRDLERLQGEMERVFQGLRRPFASERPALNVWTNQDGALVTAELPGVDEADLDISVTGSNLTLRGERKAGGDCEYHRQERDLGKFVRTVELPFQVDAGKVQAKLAKGILEVRLPRAEADKPRKIRITAA